MIWLVIPTYGQSPWLAGMIEDCGLPRDQIVLVRTRPAAAAPPGVWVLDDFGEINIQRWWNNGIDFAVKFGATHVAVFNDDIVMEPDALTIMAQTLDATGATVCWGSRVPTNGRVGWAWMINPAHGVRLDERFRWWYGDDDLRDRAWSEGHGAVSVNAPIRHMTPNLSTETNPELRALADADEILYRETRR